VQTFFSEDHRYHFPQGELSGGELVTPFERPSRVEYVLQRLKERGFPEVVAPGELDLATVEAIHDKGFLSFLETAWDEWVADGNRGEIIATCIPARRMPGLRPPRNIDGKAGYYCLSADATITKGTWRAAQSSCASAQAAFNHVDAGAKAAFALCRPPGHHASFDQYGGYCFLNNAAIVAESFRATGASRIAVLDIDFHHGNGTQDIFYHRNDVLFVSLHGHPEDAYPYFTGYADEIGAGAGEGFSVNYPMRPGTAYGPWQNALEDGIAKIRNSGAEALVVSLGVDAYQDDPISFFKLTSEDFLDCGRHIAKLKLPTVFCMEGGYAIEAVGINTVNVLEGFENG
jgi:acetoin utilization deacetylase AcuC-like enzyme